MKSRNQSSSCVWKSSRTSAKIRFWDTVLCRSVGSPTLRVRPHHYFLLQKGFVTSGVYLAGTMEYKIQRLDVDQAKAKRDLAQAKEKMFKTHIVPSGVDSEGLEEYWQTLAHGNATERHSAGVEFDPGQFQTYVPPYIETLREISRKGREEREKLEEKYKDEPKVVLGESSAR